MLSALNDPSASSLFKFWPTPDCEADCSEYCAVAPKVDVKTRATTDSAYPAPNFA